MTDMYDEKKVADFTLPPYQHEDHGSVSNAGSAAVGKSLIHRAGYGCAIRAAWARV